LWWVLTSNQMYTSGDGNWPSAGRYHELIWLKSSKQLGFEMVSWWLRHLWCTVYTRPLKLILKGQVGILSQEESIHWPWKETGITRIKPLQITQLSSEISPSPESPDGSQMMGWPNDIPSGW
jgi:hypothetical protein